MPTATLPASLLAARHGLWLLPKWQEFTNYAIPPFSPDATPRQTKLSDAQISAVKALAARVHVQNSFGERVAEYSKEMKSDGDGKTAWKMWVDIHMKDWKVWTEIENVLDARGRHPRQLIGQQG